MLPEVLGMKLVKQFQPSLLNAKDIPRCTCTRITHLPIIAFPFHPGYSMDGNRWSENQSINRYQSITTRFLAIDWSLIININQLIDIDCHRLFWIPWVKCMIMRSFRTFVLSRLFTDMFLLYKHQWNTRWDFARKHVKRSPLLWLHNKLLLSQEKAIKVLFTVCCNGVWLPSWIT